jgi:hypothetical protein
MDPVGRDNPLRPLLEDTLSWCGKQNQFDFDMCLAFALRERTEEQQKWQERQEGAVLAGLLLLFCIGYFSIERRLR